MCPAHFMPSTSHLLNDMRKQGILPANRDTCRSREPKAALGARPAPGTDSAVLEGAPADRHLPSLPQAPPRMPSIRSGTGACHSWRQAIIPGRPFHRNKDSAGKNDTCQGFSPGCHSVASGNTIPTHERWVLAVQCPIHNCW